MSRHGKLQPSAKSSAVNGHDHRLAAILNAQQHWHKNQPTRVLSGSDFAEFLDVSASDKSSTTANQHRRFHAVIGVNLLDSVRNTFRHSRTQRIYWRIIDGNNCNIVFFCQLNQIAHGSLVRN